MMTALLERAAYLPFVALTAIGLYLMLSHRNFIKALVGLNIFQTAIIMFFIVLAVRADGTIPILNEVKHHGDTAYAEQHIAAPPTQPPPKGEELDHPLPREEGRGEGTFADAESSAASKTKKSHYDEATVMHNPLPHALMLTAIVVGVATQGVGLAILRRLKDETDSIEDTESEVD